MIPVAMRDDVAVARDVAAYFDADPVTEMESGGATDRLDGEPPPMATLDDVFGKNRLDVDSEALSKAFVEAYGPNYGEKYAGTLHAHGVAVMASAAARLGLADLAEKLRGFHEAVQGLVFIRRPNGFPWTPVATVPKQTEDEDQAALAADVAEYFEEE